MSLETTDAAQYSGDPTTKPLYYYKRYDDFIEHHKIFPASILEIGTFKGESTKVFSMAYPNAKIVTLDIHLRDIDFTGYNNIVYLQADQSCSSLLTSIIEEHFPEGVDLVIDDASHFGYISKLTFETVFPLVKNGGAYLIEDWGTGYWDSWPDGSRFQEYATHPSLERLPKRIPSHDVGMVGFVK